MKVKTLRYIRKYWDYTFCGGKLFMRRKVDGKVREYESIQAFISSWIFDNDGLFSGLAWHDRKKAIQDKRKWEKAIACK
jgi:hypothetical protein